MKNKVLISGITGIVIVTGFLGYGTINSSQKNNIIAHAESKKVDVLQPVIDNSTAGKAKIQNLMLNSIDYYKKVSGSFEYLSTAGNYDLVVDYQTDLSDNSKSYENVKILSANSSDTVESETSVYDGDTLENNKTMKKTKEIKSQQLKVEKISKSEREELKNSTIKERIKTIDGEKAYIHRVDPSYMGIAKTSLFPEDFAMGFLSDTTKWEISGNEEIAGVDTVVIKGTLNNEYSKRYTASNFKLNVDPNTGILLQMEVTDATGKIKESIKTTSIKINGDLNNKLFTIQ